MVVTMCIRLLYLFVFIIIIFRSWLCDLYKYIKINGGNKMKKIYIAKSMSL